MPHIDGTLIIGSNFKARAPATAKTTPSQPECKSKICSVNAPHPARPFIFGATDGLPTIISLVEAKATKSYHDLKLLDTFYTVHWDHQQKPLPAPVQECVDTGCFVKVRHEAKKYSTNTEEAHLLPKVVQTIMREGWTIWDHQALFQFFDYPWA